MRIYGDCKVLLSEIARDVMEMGILKHSKSMQQLDVSNNPQYDTKEIVNYSYCLQSLQFEDELFKADPLCKEWAKAELEERVTPEYIESPGKAWLKRKAFWEPLVKAGNFGYTYNNRMQECSNLDRVIEALAENQDSRQAILSIWDRQEDIYGFNGKRRVPCSIYYQFLIQHDRVDVIYAQRSADAFNHLGNDIWLAYMLMVHVTDRLNLLTANGYKPGFLYHNIGSLHVYRKDWAAIQETLCK